MQSPRVQSVSVSYFRGISRGSLTLTDATGQAQSALILGDNGSGKSSYLEAINFGITGRPPHLIEPNRRRRIDPRSLIAGADDETYADVQLSDGRTLRSTLTSPTEATDFRLVAVLIKREHLLAFGRGNDDQRGGFLQTLVETRFLPKDERGDDEELLVQKKAVARGQFESVHTELRRLLRAPTYEMPELNPRDVEIFRTAKRITRKQMRKGRARQHGTKADELVALGERLQVAADQHELASNELANARRSRQLRRVSGILVTASDRLNIAFQKLAHQDTRRIVSRIEIAQGDGGRVALSVILSNGTSVPAASVLSEASLDLAALLAIVSLVQDGVTRGQPPVLILDDVFHSVDNTLRDRLAGYLFDELSDWQLIIAFHDRVWFERFGDIAKEKRFPYVRRRIWRGADGEIRVAEGYRASKEHLDELMVSGDFSVVPTASARVLEELSESLSMSLKCRVFRTESDKYTLGDLWPGIRERCEGYPGLKVLMDKLDETKYLRNLVGAHSTSWAEAYSDNDANEFGRAVIDLYNAVICAVCSSPLRYKKDGHICRCGTLRAT